MNRMYMGRRGGRLLLALSILGAAPISALTPARPLPQYHKKYWQTEQNLPGNEVWAIDYAPDGHLLVGTGAGLARFDGLRFTSPAIDDPVDLGKEWISAIATAHDGGFWVATHGPWRVPLARLGRPSDTLWQTNGGACGGCSRTPRAPCGPVLNRALLRLSGDRFVDVPGVTGSRHWFSIAGDGSGTIWAVTAEGLSRIRNGQATPVLDNRIVGTVLSVARGGDGTISAGTTRGLYRVPDAHNSRVERQRGLSGLVVGILCDQSGEVWVATWGNGLYRVNGKSVDHWGVQEEGLPDNFVTILFEDHEGDLWIGMRTGGLGRWKDTFLVPYEPPHLVSGYLASAITGDPTDGSLLLGAWRSGILRFLQERADGALSDALRSAVDFRARAGRGYARQYLGRCRAGRSRSVRWQTLPAAPSPRRHANEPAFDDPLGPGERGVWIGTEEKGIVR